MLKISEKLEFLMESVDGEGNKNWKKDAVIAFSLLAFIFILVIVCNI